jgi:hypothetical protein
LIEDTGSGGQGQPGGCRLDHQPVCPVPRVMSLSRSALAVPVCLLAQDALKRASWQSREESARRSRRSDRSGQDPGDPRQLREHWRTLAKLAVALGRVLEPVLMRSIRTCYKIPVSRSRPLEEVVYTK